MGIMKKFNQPQSVVAFNEEQIFIKDEFIRKASEITKDTIIKFNNEAKDYHNFLNNSKCLDALKNIIETHNLFYLPEVKTSISIIATYYCNNQYIKIDLGTPNPDTSEISKIEEEFRHKIINDPRVITHSIQEQISLEIDRLFTNNRIHHVSARIEWDHQVLIVDKENNFREFRTPKTKVVEGAKHINLRIGQIRPNNFSVNLHSDWSLRNHRDLLKPNHFYQYKFSDTPTEIELDKQIAFAFSTINDLSPREALDRYLYMRINGYD